MVLLLLSLYVNDVHEIFGLVVYGRDSVNYTEMDFYECGRH